MYLPIVRTLLWQSIGYMYGLLVVAQMKVHDSFFFLIRLFGSDDLMYVRMPQH